MAGPSPAMTNWQGDRVRCAHPSYSVWPLHFWSQKLVSRVLRYFVPGACRWKKRFQATVIFVGAVRVLFQQVARDVAGPILDIQRLLRRGYRRTADQKNDDGEPRCAPVRKHGVTS